VRRLQASAAADASAVEPAAEAVAAGVDSLEVEELEHAASSPRLTTSAPVTATGRDRGER
jgi:hypothetical protein